MGTTKEKRPWIRWRKGRMEFSGEMERTACFVLTLMMLVYGAVSWLKGG